MISQTSVQTIRAASLTTANADKREAWCYPTHNASNGLLIAVLQPLSHIASIMTLGSDGRLRRYTLTYPSLAVSLDCYPNAERPEIKRMFDRCTASRNKICTVTFHWRHCIQFVRTVSQEPPCRNTLVCPKQLFSVASPQCLDPVPPKRVQYEMITAIELVIQPNTILSTCRGLLPIVLHRGLLVRYLSWTFHLGRL